jgi:hypothetical protein
MQTRTDFSTWRDKMSPIESRFRVTPAAPFCGAPWLVKLLYETNQNYCSGSVASSACHLAEPLPLLAEFLGADMTPEADHRQRAMECLTSRGIALLGNLRWIGIPQFAYATAARQIYDCTWPERPIIYPYAYKTNFDPAAIAERLEEHAHTDVIKRYVDPPT